MSAYNQIQFVITAVKIYLVVMNVDVDLDSDYMAGMYPSYYMAGMYPSYYMAGMDTYYVCKYKVTIQ